MSDGREHARDAQRIDSPVASEEPLLLTLLGVVGLLGCAAFVFAAQLGAMYVEDYDWVADTISDLGAGENEMIMDVAIYGFAAALIACGLGAAHVHLGHTWWSVGIFCLVFSAAFVIVIGARNEYGDGDNEGVVIHMYLVYAVGLFFAIGPFAMAQGAARQSHVWPWVFRASGVGWIVTAPIFLLVPTGIDGLVERLVGVMGMIWIVSLSWIWILRARADRRIADPDPWD